MSDAAVQEDVGMEERVLAQLGLQDAPPEKKPFAPPPEQEAAPDAADTTDAEPETQEATDNLIEIDFKGGKYKLPSELKDLHEGYLRQEDYTRKTQDVAERQKVIDLIEQQATAQRALQSVTHPFVEKLMALNNNLAQYQQVDWGTYSDQDPQAANKHWMTYQSLKERKATLEQEMQGAAAQHLQKLKESAENLRNENSKILSEKVKGWNSERDQKVRDFAAEKYGFSKQELSQVFDARLLRMMNDANEWHQLQASKPSIQKQAAQAQKTLKPSATQNTPKASLVQANLRREVKSAKTDATKARAIEKLLMNRF